MNTATPALIDSHTHIDVDAYDGDRAAVIARAIAAGVTRQLVPAVDAATWPQLREVCARHPGLLPLYGLHPAYLERHDDARDLVALREWLVREHAIGVGECGLDWYIDAPDRERQLALFRAQCRLARELDLPLIIHARRATEDVILVLREVGGLRGIVHSYGGSAEQARQLHQLGFLIGIGGPVTYPRANRLRPIVAAMPLEQLALETDSPDQPLVDHRGERNEPARLTKILDVVASLRSESRDAIAAASTANVERVFRL